jgi:FtsP/CotA-like multicopper oxidase with cupredoxin domain
MQLQIPESEAGQNSWDDFPANAEPAMANAGPMAGPPFLQIGTEGGYLPAAVPVDGKKFQVLLAPAERADLVVDFTGMAGKDSSSSTMRPVRSRRCGDFRLLPEEPQDTRIGSWLGPNTRTLLKVKVVAGPGSEPLPATITLPFLPPFGDTPLVTQEPGVPTQIPNGVTVRNLTLNEASTSTGVSPSTSGPTKRPTRASSGRNIPIQPRRSSRRAPQKSGQSRT